MSSLEHSHQYIMHMGGRGRDLPNKHRYVPLLDPIQRIFISLLKTLLMHAITICQHQSRTTISSRDIQCSVGAESRSRECSVMLPFDPNGIDMSEGAEDSDYLPGADDDDDYLCEEEDEDRAGEVDAFIRDHDELVDSDSCCMDSEDDTPTGQPDIGPDSEEKDVLTFPISTDLCSPYFLRVLNEEILSSGRSVVMSIQAAVSLEDVLSDHLGLLFEGSPRCLLRLSLQDVINTAPFCFPPTPSTDSSTLMGSPTSTTTTASSSASSSSAASLQAALSMYPTSFLQTQYPEDPVLALTSVIDTPTVLQSSLYSSSKGVRVAKPLYLHVASEEEHRAAVCTGTAVDVAAATTTTITATNKALFLNSPLPSLSSLRDA